MDKIVPTRRYTVKKKVREFPFPSRDVTTNLSLGGNNDVITELFLPRGSLVSDIPAVDGKLVNLFLRCISFFLYTKEPSVYNRQLLIIYCKTVGSGDGCSTRLPPMKCSGRLLLYNLFFSLVKLVQKM
jgi:hypothetical protein